MIIELPFNFGDTVYILDKGKIVTGKIYAVSVNPSKPITIFLTISGITCTRSYFEVFKDKEDCIKYWISLQEDV